MNMDNSVGIAAGREDIRGLNGNGKNEIKIKFKKKTEQDTITMWPDPTFSASSPWKITGLFLNVLSTGMGTTFKNMYKEQ